MAAEGGTMTGSEARHGAKHLDAAFLQVQTTTDSRAEAMELARVAVESRLAACAQVAGPMTSTYWWDDGVERAEEWLVVLKLPADRYEELAALLTERHSYDEPEIVATPIIRGSASYLTWITEETRPRPAERANG
jgi:periplasmic divalent cation tolerance protein